MQGNCAHVFAIEVLVHFERVAFVIGVGIERAVQRRQLGARNLDDRPMHARDDADGALNLRLGMVVRVAQC
jgi:hypothetical protein